MVAGGRSAPPGWRQAFLCVSAKCDGWKWVHRDDFHKLPSCHKCGAKFDFKKYEWHDKRLSTTPSTIRKRSEAKDAPWAGGKTGQASARAKAKAKAKPKAQAADKNAQDAKDTSTVKPLSELKPVGRQPQEGDDTGTPRKLPSGHLIVDPAKAAKDPVYHCQMQADILEHMGIDITDPRRVEAQRRLTAAQEAREAQRPPEEKAAALRSTIMRLSGELTSLATARLSQEEEYKAICKKLHDSQAEIEHIEKDLNAAQDALRTQEALIREKRAAAASPSLKVGPQRKLTPEVAPKPEEACRMMRDYIFYHWSDVEDTGTDYPILQHLTALQGAIELHVQQCEARERADDADGAGDMADVEETQPPAKRRHGWDTAASGGTDTPIIQISDLSGISEEDFPVLDAQLPEGKPTPTAGVIKALKADTKQALAAVRKGPKGGKGKSKSKSGKGQNFHTPQDAEQTLDALLQQARLGTPAAGAESGHLGSSASSGSTSSVAPQRSLMEGVASALGAAASASRQRSQDASASAERIPSALEPTSQPAGSAAAETASGTPAAAAAGATTGSAELGSGTGTGENQPTLSPTPPSSGAQEAGTADREGFAPAAAGQPQDPASSNQ